MRGRGNQLADMSQGAFGFSHPSCTVPARQVHLRDDWFQDDDPGQLRVGNERLEQYLRRNGMEWVIRLRELLEQLDYTMFTRRYDILGRKALHPRTLLGLVFYGVMLQQWSLRALQGLAVRDVGAWWICGGKQPDHSTIGKFLQFHTELLSEAFFEALMAFLISRLRLKAGTVAGDGTVIEAAASRYRALKQEAIEQWAAQLEQAAAQHPERDELQQRAARAADVVEVARQRTAQRLERSQDPAAVRVAITEPAAVVQPGKNGLSRPAYKPSVLVHDSGLIVGQRVEAANERRALEPMLAQHRTLFGCDPEHVLLDAGYFAIELLRACVAQGIDVLCPSGKAQADEDWERQGYRGKFAKSRFAYDAERDAYRCPAGQWLTHRERSHDARGPYHGYSTTACAACELRAQCTDAKAGRRIKRHEGEEYQEAMREVLGQARARQLYRQRGRIAEPPFAEIRERQGLKRFHRRGQCGARLEWALHCIAFNLKKAVGPPMWAMTLTAWSRCRVHRRLAGMVCIVRSGNRVLIVLQHRSSP